MNKNMQIPRVLIQENDFPQKIPRDIKDSFLEVIDSEGKTIALFFLYNSLHKTDFKDGFDFAEYYDDLDFSKLEEEDYQEAMEITGVSSPEELPDDYEIYKEIYADFGLLSRLFVPYGRLAYPYGLNEEWKKKYTDFVYELFVWEIDLKKVFSELSNYEKDFLDIVNFVFCTIGVKESTERFKKVFSEESIDAFINLD